MTAAGAKAKAKDNGVAPADDESDLKALLLAPEDLDTETTDIEIEGIGTITVRPLDREASYLVAQKKTMRESEIQMVVCGMVTPQLTFDEAKLLLKKKAGIIQTICDVISDISGMGEGSRKEAIQRFLDDE